MKFNKKAQVFSALIIFFLVLLIFIFAAPIIFPFISIGVGSTGGATGFVIKAFPFILLIALIAVGLKILTSGGELF